MNTLPEPQILRFTRWLEAQRGLRFDGRIAGLIGGWVGL